MIVIAGLGNPGKEYENTRHNAGYGAVDALARDLKASGWTREHRAMVAKGNLAGERCLLVKPLTYMNLSGESIREIMEYYKVPVENLLVFSDDVALPTGQLRIRAKGSAGGHNGLKNIILHLATEEFARIRIGVGEDARGDLIGHVLGHFNAGDSKLMDEAYDKAAQAAVCWAEEGIQAAMNRFNTKPPKKEKPAKEKPAIETTAPAEKSQTAENQKEQTDDQSTENTAGGAGGL